MKKTLDPAIEGFSCFYGRRLFADGLGGLIDHFILLLNATGERTVKECDQVEHDQGEDADSAEFHHDFGFEYYQ